MRQAPLAGGPPSADQGPGHVNPGGTRALFGLLIASVALALASGCGLLTQDLAAAAWQMPSRGLSNVLLLALHLLAGALGCVLLPAYVLAHLRRVGGRRGAIARAGLVLAALGLALLGSGLLVTRGLPWFELRDATLRTLVVMLHTALTVAVLVGFIRHRRRAGRRSALAWRSAAVVVAASLLLAPLWLGETGETAVATAKRFAPSGLDTTIAAPVEADLRRDDYCRRCHAQTHDRWAMSAHRYASFNNPFYRAAVMSAREKLQKRDGSVQGARLCAGCHDPIPLLTGALDKPDFNPDTDPTASAGITCLTCHAVTSVDSVKGNADLTLGEVQHYPFAFSGLPALRAISDFLVKANPGPHRRAMLKPLHRDPAFCGSCHKVHIPESVNQYRWLRGQNHYDSFRLSGVSGHAVNSFYYPKQVQTNCQGCHMPARPSDDFGARPSPNGRVSSDHLFPGGNTALPWFELDRPEMALAAQREILQGAVDVDIVGLIEGNSVEGRFNGPLGPRVTVAPGKTHVAEIVLRTRTLGHHFTEGTTDSNQVWLQVVLRAGERLMAANGLPDAQGRLPPDSYQVRNHVVDRNGVRIARRNAEDIHTVVYNHQIPPGAADVVHVRFKLPPGTEPLMLEAQLLYRKFDPDYVRFALGDAAPKRDLPVTRIGGASLMLDRGTPVAADPALGPAERNRLNDYGIGLLRKPGGAQFGQAIPVFQRLARSGDLRGALNLVRLQVQQGDLAAADALIRATDWRGLENPWTLDWFAALVNRDRGRLDEAATLLERIIATDYPDARARGMDFGQDERVLGELGDLKLVQLLSASGAPEARQAAIAAAEALFKRALALDPENPRVHHALSTLAAQRGDMDTAVRHRTLHARYKRDETAAEEAVTRARAADPYLDQLAQAVTLHDLR